MRWVLAGRYVYVVYGGQINLFSLVVPEEFIHFTRRSLSIWYGIVLAWCGAAGRVLDHGFIIVVVPERDLN